MARRGSHAAAAAAIVALVALSAVKNVTASTTGLLSTAAATLGGSSSGSSGAAALPAAHESAVDAAVSAASGILPAGDSNILPHELPAARPAEPDVDCTYECAESVKVSGDVTSPGVFFLDVKFKPLPGIDAKMMRWLFDNVQKPVTNPEDGKRWPMYLVFHRADHVYHTAENLGADGKTQVGTVYRWVEFPLNGCTYDKLSATAPWTCPLHRRGVLKEDAYPTWAKLFHTKVDMEVTDISDNGVTFVRTERNPFFGGSGVRTVVTTRHTWLDDAAGLRLRTQQWVGLHTAEGSGFNGTEPQFDTGMLAPVSNAVIKLRYLDGALNYPSNMTAAGWAAALHYIQEYGGTRKWLAQAYNAAGGGEPQ